MTIMDDFGEHRQDFYVSNQYMQFPSLTLGSLLSLWKAT